MVVGGGEDVKLIDEDVLSGMDTADREQGILSVKRLRYYATKASTIIIYVEIYPIHLISLQMLAMVPTTTTTTMN